uniref:Transmembrane protein n=2 Tax=Noccaea caerulescens TaxID=107243 RepID=A0A1J3DYN2_NOCCA
MDKAETEQEEEEEFSEWVVIQTSPKSPPTDASTPQNSPIPQPSHRRENPVDNDDEEDDAVVPVVGEEEGESSSAVNLSLPWRVMEIVKKRLIKDSVFFFHAVERVRCNYLTRRRVFWSFTLIGGFFLVSNLVYVKIVRWWRRLQEEKLRFLLLLLREKDQKIKELMVEIGRLNELLASRRRVRVVRVV